MAKYQRLTAHEREEIYHMLIDGYNIRSIANTLTRSPSTISREIKRNYYNHSICYRPIFAQQRYNSLKRKKRPNHKLQCNDRLRKKVLELLRKKWSPEQIAKRLKIMYPDDMNMRISHESIYSYIYVKKQE